LIRQGFTVGSSKQPTQVAIGSNCELCLPLSFSSKRGLSCVKDTQKIMGLGATRREPANKRLWRSEGDHDKNELMRSATELCDARIRYISIDDVSLGCGVFRLPALIVDDTTEYMFLNLIGFEQLRMEARNNVTSLSTTRWTWHFFSKTGILVNALGSDKVVVKLILNNNSLTTWGKIPPYEVFFPILV